MACMKHIPVDVVMKYSEELLARYGGKVRARTAQRARKPPVPLNRAVRGHYETEKNFTTL